MMEEMEEFVKTLTDVDPTEFMEDDDELEEENSEGSHYIYKVIHADVSDPAIRAYIKRHITPSSIYLPRIREEGNDRLVPALSDSHKAVVADFEDVLESDFEVSRKNMKRIANVSVDAVESLADLAKEHDSPRAYIILTEVLKTAMESQEKLVSIHELKNKASGSSPSGPQSVKNEHNQTAIFIGNTTELNNLATKMIADRMQNAESSQED